MYTPYVSTQRDDRIDYTGSRDDRKQGELVNIDITLNAQAFINVSKKRICGQAHPQAQKVWLSVLNELKKVDEPLFNNCVPECVYRNGLCPELKCCGKIHSPGFKDILDNYRAALVDRNQVYIDKSWRPVKYNLDTFETYKVNTDGVVIGQRGVLKPVLDKDGYETVTLREGNKQICANVHRIVACTFIPNNACKPSINHKNNKRTSNRVNNLEWCTAKENAEHASSQGRMSGHNNGVKNGQSKLTEEDVKDIKSMLNEGKSLKEIGLKHEISTQTVSNIKLGVTWKHVK